MGQQIFEIAIKSGKYQHNNDLHKLFSHIQQLPPFGDLVKFLEGLEQSPKGIEKHVAEKVAKWLTKKTDLKVIADGDNLIVPSLATSGTVDVETMDSDIIVTMGVGECIVVGNIQNQVRGNVYNNCL
ncbi:hypothetical protein CSV79_05240 [Sporosarcina sp. P13]|uniref:hypothetical protein n=1 Tax=Sporosarcina sp. P13 TaxID=2048263 RepID=UPI000C16E52D|nr:hypothetical protein [Sporosarcina sp. P13]PIC64766.1 hypothetical protein CSV79_05240 [Sporosarcina sp. P13]